MVKKTNLFPKNKEHFKKLIPFAKKILLVLKENKINFVIYSSYATFLHTKDKNLRVHDLDILIKEKDYPKIMQALEKRKIKFKFLPEWDTLEIKKRKLKIDIDRMGKGCKGIKQGCLPKKTVRGNFYGIPVKLVTIQDLYNTYYRGYKLVPEEKVKLGKKVQYLKKFMNKK
jgi:hypothetical protein